MVSNIFYFHPYLGKWSNLTNIFQMGWNHQLGFVWHFAAFGSPPKNGHHFVTPKWRRRNFAFAAEHCLLPHDLWTGGLFCGTFQATWSNQNEIWQVDGWYGCHGWGFGFVVFFWWITTGICSTKSTSRDILWGAKCIMTVVLKNDQGWIL